MIFRVLLILVTLGFGASAQNELEVLPVQGNIYAIFGPGGNTTVQVGPYWTLVVDAQPAALSPKVLEAIKRLSPHPIRYIILTNGKEQNSGGAGALSKAGLYVRVIDSVDPRGAETRAAIMAHLNVLNRMTEEKVPSDRWPTDSYFTGEWSIFSNGEAVQLLHIQAAQTDGDTLVFFRRSDVISAGGIFDPTSYPRFDAHEGGSIDGIIDGLNRIVEIAVPGEDQEGGTVVIPGCGRLSDQTDVANYRDMATIIRDRVRDMVAKGMSLEQVKTSRPTRDYDGLYSRPDWTGDMFVEAVYHDLSNSSKANKASK